MTDSRTLDAQQRPPESLRALFKWVQKRSCEDLGSSKDVLDFTDLQGEQREKLVQHEACQAATMATTFADFLGSAAHPDRYPQTKAPVSDSTVFEIKSLPGLYVLPSLFPPAVQIELLNRLFHRDLANPMHKTNLDLHYYLARQGKQIDAVSNPGRDISFFEENPQRTFIPKDVSMHKPLSIQQALEKKLRWMTLGGQYDWTVKKYPPENPPAFPQDLARLLRGLFPDVDAQAAIVNLYSPGDTLSVHRDVSEECDRGLISLSIGCEGIFILGTEEGSQAVTIRLRSGDAVLMTGKSRFAWHAIPKVMAGTCPEWLQDWPAVPERRVKYENWKGWMKNKRININVRQMRDVNS